MSGVWAPVRPDGRLVVGGEGGTVLAVVLVLDGAPVMIIAQIVRVGLVAIPPR